MLVVVMHHIAGDGWSMGPLWRDLAEAYSARRDGVVPGWRALPVQYADYTLWQRELLAQVGDEQLAYWREALAGLPRELALPHDRPRPAQSSFRGDRVRFSASAEVHAGLLRMARTHHCTLFMVLQAGLAVLLSRLGAGTDIPIGTPVAGRGDDALDDLVGFFINTLVLRTDLSGDPTFAQVLQRVRESDLDAFAHQDLPFERLVEEVNPARSTSHHPLFQVMFALQNDDHVDLRLPGVKAALEPIESRAAKFDLSVDVAERIGEDGEPAGLDGAIEYSTDLFDHDTVQGMAERLLRVIGSAVADPDAPVSRFDILGEKERQEILTSWNDTAAAHPTDRFIHELFQDQARRTPEATAVVCDRTTLTYAELNTRANRLAHLLLAEGVRPEDRVAVALPRSCDHMVALLAILKAGAAYLPIDPGYPAHRIAYMLDDARPAALLTTSEAIGHTGFVTLRLNRDSVMQEIDRHSERDVDDDERPVPLSPLNPAYVIYTSGSTGEPKGVAVEHQALLNLYHTHHAQLFGPEHRATGGPRLRCAVTASFSFDTSLEGLLALTAGNELHIIGDDVRQDPRALVSYVAGNRIDFLDLTPGYAQLALDAGLLTNERHRPATIMIGGEAAGQSLWNQLREAPGTTGLNYYGPTECTVDALSLPVADSPLPMIGRPLPNLRAYVLDSDLSPVPPGVKGELFLAGRQLARGYVGRPGLTAERFVACPWADPGERMYRTGDLARWTRDGVLEFLGRADEQVKVRGFRVEPGEIRAALATHPDVDQAEVIVREERPGDGRLIGYVTPASADSPPSSAVLREFLAGQLPMFMVPTAVIVLEAFPLTPNGKLDRHALPAPALTSTTRREPQTPQETALCGIFAEVLELDSVGMDDNFFELGGHSLLAIKLISRVRSVLGRTLRLADLFQTPTVSGILADGSADGIPAVDTLLPLRVVESGIEPLFCIHPITGLAWCYAGLLNHLDRNCPIYGLQVVGADGITSMPASFDELLDGYVARIKSVQPSGPYRLLGWSLGGTIAHAVACRLQQLGDEVALLALMDAAPASGDDRLSAGEAEHTITALIRREGLVVSDLPDQLVRNLATAVETTLGLLRQSEPAVFTGSMRLFVATEETDTPVTAAHWQSYVEGVVIESRVQCAHFDMATPAALAQIGRELSALLASG
ncbi:amino acid adenylation domain-containing protein [Nonomuraea angiospora]|uniref:non-ribosomal peptide synthetase n=1 Tax=Nonomuraea angiospora TaxID=46172 RepID=UPI0034504DAF